MLVNPLLRTCAKQQLTIIISWVSFAFAQMGIAQISKIVLLVYEYVARSAARSSESPFKNIRRENKSHPFHHLCQLVINQSLIHHLAVTEQSSQHVRTQPNVRESQSADVVPAVLDEAPSQLWRIAPPGGEPSSAMEGSELLALLSSSKISAHVYVWRTDWVDWKPVAIVFPDFFRNQ